MAKEPAIHYNNLRRSTVMLLASHDDVAASIKAHAIAHHAALEAVRQERARQLKLTEGVGKYAKSVSTGNTEH